MIEVAIFAVNYFSENTYVLYDETKEAVVIDCGCLQNGERQRLSRFLEEKGLSLKRNLCTHLHLDHLFGNGYIRQTYGISPEASRDDEASLPSAEEQGRTFGLPFPVEDVPLKSYLQEGDRVRFGHSELEVLAVPGHTPGGLAFYAPESKMVFVGDSLFAGSIGRTDLWGGSQQQLVSALRSKILTLPEETVVYPGHGPATTVGEEKHHNMYVSF